MDQSLLKKVPAKTPVAEFMIPNTVNLRNPSSVVRLHIISFQTDFPTNMKQELLKCEGRKSWNIRLFSSLNLVPIPISVALDQALLLISVPFSFRGNILFLASLFFKDLA